MLQNLFIIAFSLYSGYHTKTLLFYVDDIKCNNMHHPFNKYYPTPCSQWKNLMMPYFHQITCTIVEEPTGEILSACSPIFGTMNDPVTMNYTIKKTCTIFDVKCHLLKDQYTLEVDASLNNPSHPSFLFLQLCVSICLFIYTCKYYGLFNITLLRMLLLQSFRNNGKQFKQIQ